MRSHKCPLDTWTPKPRKKGQGEWAQLYEHLEKAHPNLNGRQLREILYPSSKEKELT